jgi:hypothetical protein
MVNDYDLNVYGQHKNVLLLTAYQQCFDSFGELIASYDPQTTFSFIMTYPDNRKEIAWLLQVVPERLDELMREWGDQGLTDYDDWPGFSDIVNNASCPTSLLEWLGNLPTYERKQIV